MSITLKVTLIIGYIIIGFLTAFLLIYFLNKQNKYDSECDDAWIATSAIFWPIITPIMFLSVFIILFENVRKIAINASSKRKNFIDTILKNE